MTYFYRVDDETRSIFEFCIEQFLFLSSFSTDDSYNYANFSTAHSSHHMQPLAQMNLQTTAITSSSSIPLGMSSSMYQPTAMQTAGTSGIVQSLSHTQPLEQLAYTEEFFPSTAGIEEQYIYVTYPTEKKRHSGDRYGNETLLLLRNDEF